MHFILLKQVVFKYILTDQNKILVEMISQLIENIAIVLTRRKEKF